MRPRSTWPISRPGERFLSIELDADALAHPIVQDVLTSEDDVADLVISVMPPREPGPVPLGEHPAARTLDEAGALRAAGVDLAQGWLFGRARPGFVPPAGEVTGWLAARPHLGR